MNIVGIDPGATTGWVWYQTGSCPKVCGHGQFKGHDVDGMCAHAMRMANVIVIEDLATNTHAGIYPQTVAAARTQGFLEGYCKWGLGLGEIQRLSRLEVKKTLAGTLLGEFPMKTDANVWAALKELHRRGLHPDETVKKGGPLHGVKAHERAALAVAVAFALRQETKQGGE